MTDTRIASFTSASRLCGAALLATLWATGVQAAPKPADAPRAAALQGILDCRELTDGTARLACYDKATAELGSAEKSGDIVVVDKAQVAAAKREAFGFELPNLAMFNRGGEKPEPVEQVEATVDRAFKRADGSWVVILEGGARWEQIDQERVLRDPKKGSKAAIRKAAMGSYMMNIDGQRAIRTHRVN